MVTESTSLTTNESSFLLALALRRLSLIWARTESGSSWVGVAERIAPEKLDEKTRAAFKDTLPLISGNPADKGLSYRQAVAVWADALAAGFAWKPGEDIALETLDAAKAPLLGKAGESAWDKIEAGIKALPADAARLGASVKKLLEMAEPAPVAQAKSAAVISLRDHVETAVALALALERSLGARDAETPSSWVRDDQPYWLLVALAAEMPADKANASTVAEYREHSQTELQALAHCRAALAAEKLPNLDLVSLAKPNAHSEIFVVEPSAAEIFERVVDALNQALAPSGVALGLSGHVLAARDLSAEPGKLGKLAEQVWREARAAAQGGLAGAAQFAPLADVARRNPVKLKEAETPAVAATAAPARLKPTLVAASPIAGQNASLGAATTPDAGDAVAVAACDGLETFGAPADSFASLAGLVGATRKWRQLSDAATEKIRTTTLCAVEPGRWLIQAPMGQLPGLIAETLQSWRAAWGEAAKPVCVGLASGVSLAHSEAVIAPAHAALALARAVSAKKSGASCVALFPRHSADWRSVVVATELPAVVQFGERILDLAGYLLKGSGKMERRGRPHDWVPQACLRAAAVTLPFAAATPGEVALPPRHARGNSVLTYVLTRYLGRRPFTRKRAEMRPVDQMIEAATTNRWPDLETPAAQDAALYLELAARWTDALIAGQSRPR